MDRLAKVRAARKKSPTPSVQEWADRPSLFTQDRQPATEYLAIPEVSSENRQYIPMAFVPPSVIASNKLQFIVGASMFQFGVLNSSMHMAWVRVVSGRLESRISYAPSVYNNFPWPVGLTQKQEGAVVAAAQGVLDARKNHPKASLEDLYDPLTMPADLRQAHAKLDRAVEKCYRAEAFPTERARAEHLFVLYQQQVMPLLRSAKNRGAKAATIPRRRTAEAR